MNLEFIRLIRVFGNSPCSVSELLFSCFKPVNGV